MYKSMYLRKKCSFKSDYLHVTIWETENSVQICKFKQLYISSFLFPANMY